MIETKPTVNSLVLYKIRAARVVAVDDKIEIELEGGKSKRVRPKDLTLLHPGPLHCLTDLTPRNGETLEAWELLTGGETDLRELAELIFDDYTPATAWAAWQLVAEGLYFEGSPQHVRAREPEQVAQDQAAQAAKEAEQKAWEGFLQRLERGSLAEEDRDRLREVEMLALGQRENSRILRQLGHQESRENAHRLLIKVGYWERAFNPYPGRIGLPLQDPAVELPELPKEARHDFTGLPAFAIDDQDNQDPDDALSLDGERIWVHVADVAALVPPGSGADLEARARGANLYLPERIVPMLPPALTERLGLGLHPVSPALSVGFRLNADGMLEDVELTASLVRVQRLSYDEVDQRLNEAPFRQLSALGRRFRQRRQAAGAIGLNLPEVMVRVHDEKVVVRPLPRLNSREMVTDCMLMAGEAVAGFAEDRGLAIPFAGQPAPEAKDCPADLAGMYAFRRQLKPSKLSTQPEPHAGLGSGALYAGHESVTALFGPAGAPAAQGLSGRPAAPGGRRAFPTPGGGGDCRGRSTPGRAVVQPALEAGLPAAEPGLAWGRRGGGAQRRSRRGADPRTGPGGSDAACERSQPQRPTTVGVARGRPAGSDGSVQGPRLRRGEKFSRVAGESLRISFYTCLGTRAPPVSARLEKWARP